jgi:peptidoglycan/xylan/chitin deacetylase (PgdA/CDA1 family)
LKVQTLPTTTRRKTIFLTIDDGPSADMAEKVDYLAEKEIPAIWFCTGEALERHPEPAIHAIRQGFPIANHSLRHRHFSDISLEQCRREIAEADESIEALYRDAGAERPAKHFRFPFGDKGDGKRGQIFNPALSSDPRRRAHLQSFLRELGYSQPRFEGITYAWYRSADLLDDVDWHWTFDLMEYETFRPRSIRHPRSLFGIRKLSHVLQRIEQTYPWDARGEIPRQPRWLSEPSSDEIVLIHDHEQTTEMFPKILDYLLEKRVRFA